MRRAVAVAQIRVERLELLRVVREGLDRLEVEALQTRVDGVDGVAGAVGRGRVEELRCDGLGREEHMLRRRAYMHATEEGEGKRTISPRASTKSSSFFNSSGVSIEVGLWFLLNA